MADCATDDTYRNNVNLNNKRIQQSKMSSDDKQYITSSRNNLKQELVNGQVNGKGDEVGVEEKRETCFPEQNSNVVLIAEDDLKLFEHQVAGHGTEEKGLLKHKDGRVLKPLQPPPMGKREVAFYQEIHENSEEDTGNCYASLRKFVPSYYGIACLVNKISKKNSLENGVALLQNQRRYLLLEDIIEGYKKPCVADIKIGAQTWSPDASEIKIKHEMSKYKGTKLPLGMCLTGAHYYDASSGEKCKMSRDFGKSLEPSTLKTALEQFFNKNNSSLYRTLTGRVIEKLKELEQVFNHQKSFKLFGSSILVAYDANFFTVSDSDKVTGDPDSSGSNITNIPLRVYMIDFAHFHPSEDDKVDENYLFGLRNFIKIMCDINQPITE